MNKTNENLETVRERERERESNNLKNGITLIALVITIIVLIILAGVSINLTLGDNGIFNKAKYAKEEYLNAKAKEENILIQAEAYLSNDRNSNFSESKYIKNFTPVVDFANRTYIEVSAPEIETINSMKIIGYIFFIDGRAKGVDNEGKFVFDNLQAETEYDIQIVAIDEEGNFKKSNLKKGKTTSTLYLYKTGNECIPITGGFIFDGNAQREVYTASSSPAIFTKENSILFGMNGKKAGGGIRTSKEIDLSSFTKLYIKVDNNVANGYTNNRVFGIGKIGQRITDEKYNEKYKYWYYCGLTTDTTFSLDITEITGNYYCCIFQSISQVNNVYVCINLTEMWLE